MVDEKNNQDLELLGKKLDAARKRGAEKPSEKKEESATGIAMKVGIEFVVSVAVLTYLGYLADQWLDSAPVGLIVGIFFGFAAGFRNTFHQASKMEKAKDTDRE